MAAPVTIDQRALQRWITQAVLIVYLISAYGRSVLVVMGSNRNHTGLTEQKRSRHLRYSSKHEAESEDGE